MVRSKLTKSEGDFLRRSRVVRLATVSPGAHPHNVPVCIQFDGRVLYFASERETKKVRNIATNPRVCVVADEYYEEWEENKAVMVQGRARIVAPGADFRKLRQGLVRKYPQYRGDWGPSEETDVMIVITPENVVSWGV
jgi:nitroimidazol reductase NimA-like FMN-containing flavoprotein (pyridoxamine 5'-phosphate oxidase superfamily)